VLFYPAPSPPVVGVFAVQAGQVSLVIWYEGSDCKTLPVTPPVPGAIGDLRWTGTLKQ
jgi:hypothetical protein